MTRGQIAQQIAAKIIDGSQRPPVIVARNPAKDPARNPGICRICGMYLHCLTTDNANSHGYANKYAMLADHGVIEFE